MLYVLMADSIGWEIFYDAINAFLVNLQKNNRSFVNICHGRDRKHDKVSPICK